MKRREFIVGLGAVTGIRVLAPIVVRAGDALGQTLPDPATQARNRLVVIFLQGGNDGLNTVVPRGDVSGAPRYSVYRKVRPTIAYAPEQTLALDLPGDAGQSLGFNGKLKTLHGLYRDGRVAIVQGVDYPQHSYSHFVSTDIWQSGQPGRNPDSGWIGRHLDRAGIGEGELRGLGVGTELPLILQGEQRRGVELQTLPPRFADHGPLGDPRHAAFAHFGQHPADEPLRRFAGTQAKVAVGLVDALQNVKAPSPTGNRLADALLTARVLLEQNLGVECVFVVHAGGDGGAGYDTHAGQVAVHERLLTELDGAIEAFWLGSVAGKPTGAGPIPAALASRTMVLTTSEFGRRIGEAGGAGVAGTDHGAAGPLFLIGPAGSRLVPGLHGDHPEMGTPTLPADNLTMTTELRRVYQALLQQWLADPDPGYESRYDPLRGLFK